MSVKHFSAAFAGAALLAATWPATASYAAAVCEVNSGPGTAALVELYTSEGCSSCPPADRQLRTLRARLPPGAVVVPVGLHVSYWDRLGWRDPFAQGVFDKRQRALLDQRRQQVAYTPQFFVNGDELRDWHGTLTDTILRINARPSVLAISLKTTPGMNAGSLRLDVRAHAADPHAAGALYVALTESGLESQVRNGENHGTTLRHDDTARLWLGPIPLAQGRAELHRDLALPPAWRRDRLHALAFVQDGGAHPLQAVDTASCQEDAVPAGRPR